MADIIMMLLLILISLAGTNAQSGATVTRARLLFTHQMPPVVEVLPNVANPWPYFLGQRLRLDLVDNFQMSEEQLRQVKVRQEWFKQEQHSQLQRQNQPEEQHPQMEQQQQQEHQQQQQQPQQFLLRDIHQTNQPEQISQNLRIQQTTQNIPQQEPNNGFQQVNQNQPINQEIHQTFIPQNNLFIKQEPSQLNLFSNLNFIEDQKFEFQDQLSQNPSQNNLITREMETDFQEQSTFEDVPQQFLLREIQQNKNNLHSLSDQNHALSEPNSLHNQPRNHGNHQIQQSKPIILSEEIQPEQFSQNLNVQRTTQNIPKHEPNNGFQQWNQNQPLNQEIHQTIIPQNKLFIKQEPSQGNLLSNLNIIEEQTIEFQDQVGKNPSQNNPIPRELETDFQQQSNFEDDPVLKKLSLDIQLLDQQIIELSQDFPQQGQDLHISSNSPRNQKFLSIPFVHNHHQNLNELNNLNELHNLNLFQNLNNQTHQQTSQQSGQQLPHMPQSSVSQINPQIFVSNFNDKSSSVTQQSQQQQFAQGFGQKLPTFTTHLRGSDELNPKHISQFNTPFSDANKENQLLPQSTADLTRSEGLNPQSISFVDTSLSGVNNQQQQLPPFITDLTGDEGLNPQSFSLVDTSLSGFNNQQQQLPQFITDLIANEGINPQSLSLVDTSLSGVNNQAQQLPTFTTDLTGDEILNPKSFSLVDTSLSGFTNLQQQLPEFISDLTGEEGINPQHLSLVDTSFSGFNNQQQQLPQFIKDLIGSEGFNLQPLSQVGTSFSNFNNHQQQFNKPADEININQQLFNPELNQQFINISQHRTQQTPINDLLHVENQHQSDQFNPEFNQQFIGLSQQVPQQMTINDIHLVEDQHQIDHFDNEFQLQVLQQPQQQLLQLRPTKDENKLQQSEQHKTDSKCLRPCQKILNIICGSDGVSYTNPCELNNGKCWNKDLVQRHTGLCGTSSPTADARRRGKSLASTPVKGNEVPPVILGWFAAAGPPPPEQGIR